MCRLENCRKFSALLQMTTDGFEFRLHTPWQVATSQHNLSYSNVDSFSNVLLVLLFTVTWSTLRSALPLSATVLTKMPALLLNAAMLTALRLPSGKTARLVNRYLKKILFGCLRLASTSLLSAHHLPYRYTRLCQRSDLQTRCYCLFRELSNISSNGFHLIRNSSFLLSNNKCKNSPAHHVRRLTNYMLFKIPSVVLQI